MVEEKEVKKNEINFVGGKVKLEKFFVVENKFFVEFVQQDYLLVL